MHYYNEYDKHAAAWLRELIAQKLIPAGEVDERSILDVQPDDLRRYTQCHFFAGIGGWAYALQLAGIPATRRLWTGSCPCQPFSTAGQQKGQEDERHLWPAFFNLIRECRPPTIFGEQVASSLVVGPSNPPRSMPDLRDRKTLLRILSELERESPRNLQGMRQSKGKAAQKASTCKDQRSVQEMAGREKRTCTCERGEAPSKKTPHSFQHNTGGHSKPHQSWSVRSDGDTLRPSQTQSVECSLPGSNRTQSRIHAGEHQSGVVCRECDGQLLGVAENRGSVERDSEWEERSLEQIIESDRGELEGPTIQCWLDGISADLEAESYACGAAVLGAHSVGAPHIRQRLYWVAHHHHQGSQGWQCASLSERGLELPAGESGACSGLAQSGSRGLQDAYQQHRDGRQAGSIRQANQFGIGSAWSDTNLVSCRDGKVRRIPTEPSLFPLAHGVPGRVGLLRGSGNAIVPQTAAAFILAAETARLDRA